MTRPASQINLAEILRAVQDIVPGGRHCLLGNRICGDKKFCPIHKVIIKADKSVIESFEALSLKTLAESDGWDFGFAKGAGVAAVGRISKRGRHS